MDGFTAGQAIGATSGHIRCYLSPALQVQYGYTFMIQEGFQADGWHGHQHGYTSKATLYLASVSAARPCIACYLMQVLRPELSFIACLVMPFFLSIFFFFCLSLLRLFLPCPGLAGTLVNLSRPVLPAPHSCCSGSHLVVNNTTTTLISSSTAL